jgi:hypothetical protein
MTQCVRKNMQCGVTTEAYIRIYTCLIIQLEHGCFDDREDSSISTGQLPLMITQVCYHLLVGVVNCLLINCTSVIDSQMNANARLAKIYKNFMEFTVKPALCLAVHLLLFLNFLLYVNVTLQMSVNSPQNCK